MLHWIDMRHARPSARWPADNPWGKTMKPMSLIVAAIALSIAVCPGAISAAEQQLNPKAITIKLPDQIQWKRNAAGTNEVAVLYGDPEKPLRAAVQMAARKHEPAALASQ
jgi:hypothetical protein